MHEYSLLEDVVEVILDRLQSEGPRTRPAGEAVHLSVGALAMHSEESFRQAFDLLTRGTPVEGSRLELSVVRPEIACDQCSYAGEVTEELDCHDPMPVMECPRCGAPLQVRGGRGVEHIELELP